MYRRQRRRPGRAGRVAGPWAAQRYLSAASGRIESHKCQQGLLRAYGQLLQPRPPLVLVGHRDFRDAPVFEAARALGDEVRILEKVDDAVLPCCRCSANPPNLRLTPCTHMKDEA